MNASSKPNLQFLFKFDWRMNLHIHNGELNLEKYDVEDFSSYSSETDGLYYLIIYLLFKIPELLA